MDPTIDSIFQPSDIQPLHSVLSSSPRVRSFEEWMIFTILSQYCVSFIYFLTLKESRKESRRESISIAPCPTLYGDMCTIFVFVTQRSPLGCAGLFDLNKNTVQHCFLIFLRWWHVLGLARSASFLYSSPQSITPPHFLSPSFLLLSSIFNCVWEPAFIGFYFKVSAVTSRWHTVPIPSPWRMGRTESELYKT